MLITLNNVSLNNTGGLFFFLGDVNCGLIKLWEKCRFCTLEIYPFIFHKVINIDKNNCTIFARQMGTMEGISAKFSSLEAVLKVSSFIDGENSSLCIKGLYGSSKGIVLSSAIAEASSSRIHLVISDTKEGAEYMCGDLYQVFSGQFFFFPSSASATSKIITIKDSSNKVQRSITLSAINSFNSESDDILIVTYPAAVKELCVAKVAVSQNVFCLSEGEDTDYEQLKEKLFSSGFERVDFVSEPGQFAIRGGIMDIFSYSDNVPYRIDFFGNTVESISRFDVSSQRSTEKVKKAEIFPDMQNSSSVMALGGQSIFDYIGKENCIVWSDTFEDLSALWKNFKVIALNGRNVKRLETDGSEETVSISCLPQPSFNKNFSLLADDIRKRNSEGYKVYISSRSQDQAERIRNIFKDSTRISEGVYPDFEHLESSPHEGFVCPAAKVCLYTDHQIFERYHRVKLRRQVERSERLAIEDLNGYHVGDYIVHIDHGVGIFGGLVKTNIGGRVQEAVKIMYRDGDVIFVSVHSLHKISKYKSKDGVPPKIYKLGSGAWNKLKTSTKAKIKDIAKELIGLYAERKQSRGFAFSHDSFMQNELEASFMFEDTPDQVSATKAVKADMESANPMDRLICGDVGFGKTEVAIRAAFKAVCDSKQVCVLVPTTILALQHYKTFTERLEKFPVKVDYISRLRSAKEIREATVALKEGRIDIIIGTHRLLNKKIEFKDLGLLIVDEEQKFGVAAKERLRQLKVEVDTLTLTATPIPRTLQFSLLGARDLSIINTPPPNRLPVQTEIIDFNEDLIREAIMNEVSRGGQVFFVHNRVEDIAAVEQMVRRICPQVRTVVGHGQMEPSVLEERMLDFIRGDYDVLISTTIIENGIDIPNANTMIINQAHMFGLSDLHQLRGRVGRSTVKAYCYMIVPPMTSLSEDAKRRIKAIEAFSELGSGFNIAMQDLDIRGAGNLLGGEQSGFIADMGFETYQRILNEAFMELNSQREDIPASEAEDMKFVSDCTLDTDLELYIPDDYISQITEKIKLYKELDSLKDEKQIDLFMASLQDRFGPPPEQVKELSYVVRLRNLAMDLGFEKITIKQGVMLLYFISNPQSAYYRTDRFQKLIARISSVNKGKLCSNSDNTRCWLKISGVKSIRQAYDTLLFYHYI